MPDFTLVVTHPFGDYARGDSITETDLINAAVQDHPTSVVKVMPEKTDQ